MVSWSLTTPAAAQALLSMLNEIDAEQVQFAAPTAAPGEFGDRNGTW